MISNKEYKETEYKEPEWVKERREQFEERQRRMLEYMKEIGEGPDYDPWSGYWY